MPFAAPQVKQDLENPWIPFKKVSSAYEA